MHGKQVWLNNSVVVLRDFMEGNYVLIFVEELSAEGILSFCDGAFLFPLDGSLCVPVDGLGFFFV